ncbi:SDR family oxidoreductase [Paractinoplanes maris]|uniref:SDR family oxidoreductase n=1 Tax=Paractinoplanes maris TaxID=1734446 RepID=UPI00201FFDC3|nr:SDR family oxidoreductase [Actinoplanes maris]
MTGRSAVVVGGSRGLGFGVARAARDAGARVTVVARDLAGADGEQGDATDEEFAGKVLAAARPDLLIVTAGVAPAMRPLTEHNWETFSANWQADVRIAFVWLRAALKLPLDPGSRVVVFGSAAELRGSPLSGGYAGAKATVRLMTSYAAAQGRDRGITMTTVLPGITPHTTVGETAIRAYAQASGITAEEFRARVSGAPAPESVGAQVIALVADPAAAIAGAYLLDGDGLREHAG